MPANEPLRVRESLWNIYSDVEKTCIEQLADNLETTVELIMDESDPTPKNIRKRSIKSHS